MRSILRGCLIPERFFRRAKDAAKFAFAPCRNAAREIARPPPEEISHELTRESDAIAHWRPCGRGERHGRSRTACSVRSRRCAAERRGAAWGRERGGGVGETRGRGKTCGDSDGRANETWHWDAARPLRSGNRYDAARPRDLLRSRRLDAERRSRNSACETRGNSGRAQAIFASR